LADVAEAPPEAVKDGHRYLADALSSCGIDHFFHVPLVLPDAIKDMQRLGVRPIVAHSEKAAAYMADGYARASGRIGVCAAQAIGAANLAAGLLDAYMAHSPVLALSGGGTPETRDRNNYQEIDQRPIWSGLTKMSARVETAPRLPDLLGQAMRVATSGAPGPVHLELGGFTGGILGGETNSPMPPEPRWALCPSVRQPAAQADIVQALETIARARRPVVVAGSAIRTSGAAEALRRFVRLFSLPLATSLDAKAALPDADPLSIGVVGTYSRDTANMLVSEADLVILVGTTAGSMVTAAWSIPKPGIAAIQIDVDPRELGRNYPLVVGLAGDPATVLDQLFDAARSSTERPDWLARVAELKAQWARIAAPFEEETTLPIRPERLCRELSGALPDDVLLVVDTGHTAAWAARHVYLEKPGQRILRAAGSLGWSYPASLGAKCARPDQSIVCFCGDGAFLYHLSEMETAVRYGINTVTVINNNHGYSQEKPIWDGSSSYDHNWRFSPVSYAEVARAFGCRSWRVEEPGDLGPAMAEALAAQSPAIIEVISDESVTAAPPWKPHDEQG
jgi:acetolactate synthase-1/2/3 large subunit